jgi:hypothetical protein
VILTDMSEEYTDYIFKVEEEAERATSQQAVFDPEDGGTMFL